MNRIFTIIVLSFLISSAFAQDPKRFFPDDKLITPGTFYYPEHWPQSQWERDFKNMVAMGFEYVHMAEFSWAFLEPTEGKYNFTWLDKAVDLAAKQGLKIILCTPTATTPAWMGIKYPEVYLMNSNYQRGEHGSRQNNSLANPVYRKLSGKIITEMAKRYGKHPAVWGWQLDNEPEAKEDYSPSSQAAFRIFLKEKYQTIVKLNEAWGTAFWGIQYNNFGEISIHNTNAIAWWGNNPHALLDFKRFTATLQAEFLDEQATILRQHISENQFITTNYVAVANNADARLTEKLDFIAYTSYLNNGSANLGDNGFRLGNPNNLLLANDYFRPIKGVTGVLEIQPGQVNWANVNSLLLPGTVRMWLWHAMAGGAKLASSYRYRQVLYGVEQYHSGIMQNDGISPAQGGQEYMQFIAEIKQLEKLGLETTEPEYYAQKRTAILWSHENMWDHQRQPQNVNWNIWAHTAKYHQALMSLGAPVDYISENDDFSNYRFMVVPAYQAVDSALVEKWKNYVENGGNLILTCRTATKTREGHFWEAGWGAPIYDLIGAKIKAYDMLPPHRPGTVTSGENQHEWSVWGELLEAKKKDYIRVYYSDQFYVGNAAVTQRKLGKGTVTYIGVDTKDAMMEKTLLKNIFTDNKLTVNNYPEGVMVYWREGFWIAVNYRSDTYEMKLPANAKIIIGKNQLEPAGVLVWKE